MVEITYLAIIGIGLAAMFFGYGFGLFEGRNQGYKKRKGEEALEEKDKPATPSNPVTVMVDDPGLLRIKNENGQFTLDLDGTRVNVSAFSADQRKRLIEMLNLTRRQAGSGWRNCSGSTLTSICNRNRGRCRRGWRRNHRGRHRLPLQPGPHQI